MVTRRAIALGGGGAKGAYEVGVWQALDELKIGFDVVTGTSVGALNGTLMAMGALEQTVELWSGLDNTQVMSEIPALSDDADALRQVYRAFVNQAFKNGGINVSPLEERVRALIDEPLLRSGRVELGIVTVEFPSFKPVEWFLPQIPEGQLADFLLASAACFPAFKPKEIDGVSFIDGGYTNNIPVDLALRAQSQIDEIIAVDVEGVGIVRRIETKLPITTLRSYWDLGSILVFDREVCRRNIRLGYLDAMKAFGSFEGHAYTFAPGERQRLEQRRLRTVSECCLTLLDSLTGEGKRELSLAVASRIVSAATKRRVSSEGELDLCELMLASAELAAELLGLEPTVLYTAETFDDALLEAYGRLTAETAGIINALERNKAPNLMRLMSRWKKEHLLAVCVFNLHRIMLRQPVFSPQLAVTLMPREFLAAIYLEALCRRDPDPR